MRSSPPPPLPRHVQQGSVAQTIRALPVGTSPSEVWRGAALMLLRLNPKEASILAEVFEDETTRDDTRLLVLDLFAGAGTFEVQAIMRRLLSLAIARRSNRTFVSFVQRLGLLEEPDGPTLRYLMSVYAEARGEPEDVRAACAYALGTCAGHAFLCGDEDAAVRATEMVRRDLFLVAKPSERRALVLALGNAGLMTDLPAIVRAANDPEPQVRAAAAVALRKIDAAEARAQLVSMLSDQDARVGESAVVALSEHRRLAEPEIDQIAELVVAGRTPTSLDGRLLRLLVAQKSALVSRAHRATSLENALRLLLGRVEAAVEASAVERRFPSATFQAAQVAPTQMQPRGDSGSVPVMRSPSVPAMRASGFVARVPQTNPYAAQSAASGHPFAPESDDIHAFPPSSMGDRTQCEDFRQTIRKERESKPTVVVAPAATETFPEIPPSSDSPTMIRAPLADEASGHSSEGSLEPPVWIEGAIPDHGMTTIAMDLGDAVAPGVYRLVPGEGGTRPDHLASPAHDAAVEAMRKRMLELGLDPNARTSMLPLPPPKTATRK